jgi:hypothetical protein
MSDAPVPRPARAWPALLTLVLAASAGCVERRGQTASPHHELLAAGWIDAGTIGAATRDDPERLAALAGAGARGRVLRLDRLLDLYDAARFAADKHARDALWLALGGYSSARGIDASREAVLRLLDEAYAIENLTYEEPDALSEDEFGFVADAIMLLSTDMFLPDSAEALITQTLAYRVLAEGGHPRIADNAHWRLYDHVRGVLEGAVELGPDLRADVLVHALYAEREDLTVWLEDLAPHAQPPLPSPSELWALLETHRGALLEHPRWEPVVAARAEREAQLRETILALLPRPRSPGWVLPSLPRGTGRRESLAPALLLAAGTLTLEPTSESPRALPTDALGSDAALAVEGLLVRDGRGTLLLAADPQTPAPDYAAVLRLLAEARAATLELAVHEPHLHDGEAPVVVALPLHVARPDDLGPGARALRDARIHVQLSGRGPRVRIDGRWLGAAPVLPSDTARLITELRRAYPRERVISLALAPDLQHGQVVDLLAALIGGIDPAFFAAGWMPDAELVGSPAGDAEADRKLAARTALVAAQPQINARSLDGLDEHDRARIKQAAVALRDCVPELEVPLPKQGLTLSLELAEGRLVELAASGRALDRAALERFEGCARERLVGFRLAVDEAVTLSLIVTTGSTARLVPR